MRRLLPALLLASFLFLPSAARAGDSVDIRFMKDLVIEEGDVVETAIALFGSVVVRGTVEGHAVSFIGAVKIGPKGSVGGDAVAIGGRVAREEGSRLGGQSVALSGPDRKFASLLFVGLPMAAALFAGIGALLLIASSLGFVALIVLILLLFDNQVRAVRQILRADPWKCLALGLLGFLGMMPLMVLLAITIVGIPLVFVVAAVGMAAICLGATAICEWVGEEIAKKLKRPLQPVWAGLLGLTALFAVGFVPFLGRVIHALVILAGFGAVLQTRFRAGKAP